MTKLLLIFIVLFSVFISADFDPLDVCEMDTPPTIELKHCSKSLHSG